MSSLPVRRIAMAGLLLGAAQGFVAFAGSGAFAAVVGPRADIVPGEIIVRYRTLPSSAMRTGALAPVAGAQVVRPLLVPGADLVHVRPGQEAAAVAALQRNPDVLFAEVNRVLHAVTTPNDSYFRLLWGFNNTGQAVNGSSGKVDADIDAPEAWQLGGHFTAADIIAVTDTGITLTHPDLAGNIFTNPGESGGGRETNGVDDDHNGYVDDWRGWNFVDGNNNPTDDEYPNYHGTHVSGTIAAIANNGMGVAGVASFPATQGRWSSPRILPIKVLDLNGSGTIDAVADGMIYAGKMGAKVVNISIGGYGTSETLDDAILASPKTLFVVAAGNDGNDNDEFAFTPCVATPGTKIANKICVAATDSNDRIASFSNFGRKTVDLAAPGVDILSTMPPGSYQYLSGTSMATPAVAGAAILLDALFPGSMPAQTKARILAGVDTLAALKNRVASSGRLNLYKAGAESIVTKTGAWLSFVAGAGETNRITVRPVTVNGVQMYEFSDPYTGPETPIQGGSRLVPASGCVSVTVNVVRCPAAGISRIAVRAGDLDDVVYGPTVHIPMYVDGGPGADDIYTGTADDTLIGGPGRDRFHSGAGNDFIDARDGEADLLFDCGDRPDSDAVPGDRDTVYADRGLDPVTASPTNCEIVHLQ